MGNPTAAHPSFATGASEDRAILVGQPAGWWSSRTIQALAILILVGAALRFATLNVQSIWLDESATMILVHRGFTGMLSHLSGSESAPPLYYVLVFAWTKIVGAGPIGFRSFSALVGTLTIPAMYAVGRRVSPRVGLWAAALTMLNPAMYYYSQEARCYELLVLFSAIAFACWQAAVDRPTRRALWLWCCFTILALLTHYFAAFLFVPEALILMRRLGSRRAAAPIGVVLLAGVALAPLAYSQVGNGAKISWIESTSLVSRVAETAKEFVVGVYGPLEVFSAVLAGLLTLVALWLVLRRSVGRERAIARDGAIVATAAIAIPLIAAAIHVFDVFDGRNVIAAWVPFALVVAIGLGGRHAGRGGGAVGAALLAISVAVIAGTNAIPAYQRDDWRGAAQALPRPAGPRAIVAEQNATMPLSIYLPGVQGFSSGQTIVREVVVIALRTRRTVGGPIRPSAPTQAPPGFHLASVDDAEAFAVSRFLAAKPTIVTVRSARKLIDDPTAEITLQG